MWESLNSLIEFGGPLLVKVWIAYWVYVRVEAHAYAQVAGVVAFFLFCECDRIRYLVELRTQSIRSLLNRSLRRPILERRQCGRLRKLTRKGSKRRFQPPSLRRRRREAHE
jgi:hypothetical protein